MKSWDNLCMYSYKYGMINENKTAVLPYVQNTCLTSPRNNLFCQKIALFIAFVFQNCVRI